MKKGEREKRRAAKTADQKRRRIWNKGNSGEAEIKRMEHVVYREKSAANKAQKAINKKRRELARLKRKAERGEKPSFGDPFKGRR